MRDAGAVCLVERVGDLDGDCQRLAGRHRAFLQPLFEGLALEILHDEERDVLILADVIQRADMRMFEL